MLLKKHISLFVATCFVLSMAAQNSPNFSCGVSEYNKKNYRSAISCFDRAIQELPFVHNLYYYRALCHIKLGENRAALNDLNTALSYRTNAYSVLNRAIVLMNMGQTEMALKDLQFLESYVDYTDDLNYYYALAFYMMKDYEQSIAYSQKFIALNPERYEGYWFVALCETERGNTQNAINAFSECLNTNAVTTDRLQLMHAKLIQLNAPDMAAVCMAKASK